MSAFLPTLVETAPYVQLSLDTLVQSIQAVFKYISLIIRYGGSHAIGANITKRKYFD